MKQEKVMENIYVFDDGVIRGFIEMNGTQLSKIYVDSFFQSQGGFQVTGRKRLEENTTEYLVKLER